MLSVVAPYKLVFVPVKPTLMFCRKARVEQFSGPWPPSVTKIKVFITLTTGYLSASTTSWSSKTSAKQLTVGVGIQKTSGTNLANIIDKLTIGTLSQIIVTSTEIVLQIPIKGWHQTTSNYLLNKNLKMNPHPAISLKNY